MISFYMIKFGNITRLYSTHSDHDNVVSINSNGEIYTSVYNNSDISIHSGFRKILELQAITGFTCEYFGLCKYWLLFDFGLPS